MESKVRWFTNKEYLQLHREWASREERDDVGIHLMDREFGIAYADLPYPHTKVGFVIEDSMKFAIARLKYKISYT